MITRKEFLQQAPALIGMLMSIPALAQKTAKKTILLRSAWQTVNIGDIGHTPGILTLMEKYLPDVDIQLWPSDIGNGVEEIIRTRFPKVTVLKGPEAITAAFGTCDFLLHSSGSSLVARKDVERWSTTTGKPFGVYGISLHGVFPTPMASNSTSAAEIELLSKAKFIFFRDSASLKFAREKGITCPVMEFGPDAAFAVDLRDDASAIAFLKEHQLEEGNFLCVIPRLRYTPYWKIPAKKAAFDEFKNTRNEEMKEKDHATLCEAIIAVVKQTPMKILICPEDETQVAIGKEMLYDKLPAEIKDKVVWRNHYWLTGEAISTYVRSAGLFGMEMHSPIMCIGNGIPAIVCRFDEQTSKGIMWRDIGLGNWLFDMDNPKDVAGIVPAVLAMAKDPKAAKAKALMAGEFVVKRQRETMGVVEKAAIV